MLVAALDTDYVACAGVLVAVMLQDRGGAGARRRGAAGHEPSVTQTSEWVFRTQV